MAPRFTLDTNVLIAGLRLRRGASFRLLRPIGREQFRTVASVPLVIEYESAVKDQSRSLGLRHADIDNIIDYLCRVPERREIFYLWRPFLSDPEDDLVLELAVEAEAHFIITHNLRDFAGVEKFGLQAITPGDSLYIIGELP